MIYSPPWHLSNGLLMTLYAALRMSRKWEAFTLEPEPSYQEHIFAGANGVPIYGKWALPDLPQGQIKGTVIGTYGITGDLDNQWFLQILGRKAIANGYAVVLFDWRAHGKTAELSPALTSDGIYEGEDYIRIADAAKKLGCPAPFWLTGYSLGGQLALWGIKAGQEVATWGQDLAITADDIGGGAVICPSVDSNRSLTYLVKDELGRLLERSIARELKKLARKMATMHPEAIDASAVARANSIWGFDHELTISKLGFDSVEAYYDASCPLYFLPHLQKPTLILYAIDDPMFDPAIVQDLEAIAQQNSHIHLLMTRYGGHVGYVSSKKCQHEYGDRDRWWAWNRFFAWLEEQPNRTNTKLRNGYAIS
ncbi:MAG: alpha/beta fold hydrolase [Pseudanabaenaceae cyanobacterium bins.39]|nr:alpha/beta fold hydrolase [Pseudanabaenaceae cyanobacterium bins.39]